MIRRSDSLHPLVAGKVSVRQLPEAHLFRTRDVDHRRNSLKVAKVKCAKLVRAQLLALKQADRGWLSIDCPFQP